MTVWDNNCLAVVLNLIKDQKSWARLTRILVWEGAYPRVYGVFFKALVQAVFIFRSETWVLTPLTE